MDPTVLRHNTPRKASEGCSDTLLFVYGTLRRGYANHEVYLADALCLGKAITEERFALFVDDFPYLTKSAEISRVVGELYRIDDRTLDHIDCLEGHPDDYRREKIQVVTDLGARCSAWAYFYPKSRGRLLATGDYEDSETA
ncbi:MAG TPA: gamma-glutamylcyclotransferase [Syntrophobacteraceae bacterium]|nr:gamma-glutamylcyclotransferase [Syntrophobacteraceae bacterium]HBZ55764.1 gamma-glutamylcyclotransferase [Syntrophobacteraceae bacterium]